MTMDNIFHNVPDDLDDEFIETLVRMPTLRIERIVSRGHTSPDGFWYDQNDDEWVVLLSGGARIAFEGSPEDVTLEPGDHLTIRAHQKHRVEWTDPAKDTVWLAVFF